MIDYDYKCDCSSCKSARKKLKELKKEENGNALNYHMVKILQEILGMGNY